jgi:hypothetical protein
LQSRFFILELEAYSYEQFCEITAQVLSLQKVEEAVAKVVANAVCNKSQDMRDCIKIGTLAKSTKDVEFIADTFFWPKTRQGETQT